MESAPFIFLTLYLNGTLHGVHDIFCDCHAKAAALCLMYPLAIFPDKGFKDFFLKLFRHTDTGILHPKVGADILLPFRGGFLGYGHMDLPALRGKLQGIGQKIKKHLV